MLPHAAGPGDTTRLFGTYNTVAAVSGSLGALTAFVAASRLWLLAYPVAAAIALLATVWLSARVEVGHELDRDPLPPLHRSRGIVTRLSALFALDSFGGGFVVQSFIAYWFALKFGTTHKELAILFLAIGFLQAASFQIAVRLAGRIGLLRTMVFTHLPSNVLLAAIAFAPNYAVAVVLLLARYALSQMDVPARQAYVAAVVDPSERTAAAAYTNTARYVTRPIGPLVGGAALTIALGAPFVIAGAVKCVYDVAFYAMFRRVKVDQS
jgi:predicted MFS family arabinose efflux permease